MAIFADLPNEIVDAICANLRDGSVYDAKLKAGLHGLCLSSRRYHEIALPHLYCNISVSSIKAGPFALTICDNQNLADLIHTIHLEYDYEVQDEADQKARDQFVEQLSPRTKLALSPADEEEDASEDASNATEDEAFNDQLVCTVFSKLRNLEKLDMCVYFGDHMPIRFKTHVLSQQKPVLPNLKEVLLSHWDTEGGFSMEEVFQMLEVTKVRKLNAHMCADFGDDFTKPWNLSSVREIDIRYSCLEENSFQCLVRCCPKLEELVYISADASQYTNGEASTYQISHALRPLTGSLSSLEIDQRERCRVGLRRDEMEPTDSLKSFTKLRHLAICQFSLTREDTRGADDDDEELEDDSKALPPFLQKLPSSLETLHIMDVTEAITMELTKLAKVAAEEFPNLKEVMVDKELGLKDLFQAKSIKFVVR
ncbi:hypothetical protein PMZ80_004618 [Knufia obscura]|uniref:Leucine-rich repeat domain-containing protein n=1 Tax=Knufia obscura TaxID=1635080 RepID=A0ABR0RTK4_9EURO|nr:hypothetical protein PMZ80_004618 [Knufia obscura]